MKWCELSGVQPLAVTVLLLGSCCWCFSSEPVKPGSAANESVGSDVPWTDGKTGGESEAPRVRIREGSRLVDKVGEFQKTGDQVSFFAAESGAALRVLQNLALERVIRTLDDNSERRMWSVCGVITEFRGENYLLLTRAVLKAAPRESVAGPRGREFSDGK